MYYEKKQFPRYACEIVAGDLGRGSVFFGPFTNAYRLVISMTRLNIDLDFSNAKTLYGLSMLGSASLTTNT